jgi:copper resistance protein B
MDSSEQVGTASAPPLPTDYAADAFFASERMSAARHAMMNEDRVTYSQVLIERLELRLRGSGDGYAWEGEASTGTDRNRFVLATEGEGEFRGAVEEAELHAKWRHAIGPWFNTEVGLRHDLHPGPQRTYLVVGVDGLAPYWIDTEAQLFVSNKGDVHARFQAEIDQRITQRLVLRPAAEIDFALQDVPELGITSRVPEWSLGLRLRYEIRPTFAPYIGIERRRDDVAVRQSRQRDRDGVHMLVGVRAWF